MRLMICFSLCMLTNIINASEDDTCENFEANRWKKFIAQTEIFEAEISQIDRWKKFEADRWKKFIEQAEIFDMLDCNEHWLKVSGAMLTIPVLCYLQKPSPTAKTLEKVTIAISALCAVTTVRLAYKNKAVKNKIALRTYKEFDQYEIGCNQDFSRELCDASKMFDNATKRAGNKLLHATHKIYEHEKNKSLHH
jgi:hypothetical protein